MDLADGLEEMADRMENEAMAFRDRARELREQEWSRPPKVGTKYAEDVRVGEAVRSGDRWYRAEVVRALPDERDVKGGTALTLTGGPVVVPWEIPWGECVTYADVGPVTLGQIQAWNRVLSEQTVAQARSEEGESIADKAAWLLYREPSDGEAIEVR